MRAVVFDVDGTLAETERDGHRPAFNQAFRDLGLPDDWSVDAYGPLLETTGGRLRIARHLREIGFAGDVEATASRVHGRKTELFRTWVIGAGSDGPVPRAGVVELIAELTALGVPLAVATTGRRAWVDPLLQRLFGAPSPFSVVVTGDDVTHLKPHPEAYRLACERLGLDPGPEVVAVEDSRVGLEAALAAGLTCAVTPSAYTRHQDFRAAHLLRTDEARPLTATDLADAAYRSV